MKIDYSKFNCPGITIEEIRERTRATIRAASEDAAILISEGADENEVLAMLNSTLGGLLRINSQTE